MLRNINHCLTIIIGTIGGCLLGITGIPMGWMLGSILFVAIVSIYREKSKSTDGTMFNPIWKNIAQIILAIEVGKQINVSTFSGLFSGQVFLKLMFCIFVFLILCCGVGIVFAKATKTSFATGLLAACPGGVSAIPLLSQEIRANPMVVSTTHVLRVILVACTIPAISSAFATRSLPPSNVIHWRIEPLYENSVFELLEFLHRQPLIWTMVLVIAACLGFTFLKLFNFPSALLIGSIVGAGSLQYLASSYLGLNLTPWFPHSLDLIMQIFIGASLGVTFNRNMIYGWKQTFTCSVLVIFSLMLISLIISWMAHLLLVIPFETAILSFAPGGLAAMVATAISLHADASFVVSIQTFRLLLTLGIVSLFLVLTKNKHINSE